MLAGYRSPGFRLGFIWMLLAGMAAAGPAMDRPFRTQELCRIRDGRIRESSGLSPSSGDWFYTHNDSGDEARFFAINRRGETLATIRVTGAINRDWEDMSRGPNASIYLADIGDNNAVRPQVTVYRIPEPGLDPRQQDQTVDSAPAEKIDIQYPEGPRDAETLLVHPITGQLVIVTKSLSQSEVYTVPNPPSLTAVNRMTRVGVIRFSQLPATIRTKRDLAYRLLATGGDFSPNGDRFVVRTYTDAYEWKLTRAGLAAALARKPKQISLPATPQGEAICYAGSSNGLLISTEGDQAPVHELTRR